MSTFEKLQERWNTVIYQLYRNVYLNSIQEIDLPKSDIQKSIFEFYCTVHKTHEAIEHKTVLLHGAVELGYHTENMEFLFVKSLTEG